MVNQADRHYHLAVGVKSNFRYMVPILSSLSEIGVYMWSDLYYLISLRYLFSLTEVNNFNDMMGQSEDIYINLN